MKPTILRFVSPALMLAGLLAGGQIHAADKSTASGKPGTLQVQLIVPPTWRPMLEDNITTAFFSHLEDVFHQQGYKGGIAEVDTFDEPSPGCCLLTIYLNEWRMNHIGNIDCTFTANLQTGKKIRDLGVFSGMAFRWMSGPGRFGLADSYGNAADDAIRDLYRHVEKTGLLPGSASK